MIFTSRGAVVVEMCHHYFSQKKCTRGIEINSSCFERKAIGAGQKGSGKTRIMVSKQRKTEMDKSIFRSGDQICSGAIVSGNIRKWSIWSNQRAFSWVKHWLVSRTNPSPILRSNARVKQWAWTERVWFVKKGVLGYTDYVNAMKKEDKKNKHDYRIIDETI